MRARLFNRKPQRLWQRLRQPVACLAVVVVIIIVGVVAVAGLYYSVSRSLRGCCYFATFLLGDFCSLRFVGVLQLVVVIISAVAAAAAAPATATAIALNCCRDCCCGDFGCAGSSSCLQFSSSCSFCATFLRDCLNFLRLRALQKSFLICSRVFAVACARFCCDLRAFCMRFVCVLFVSPYATLGQRTALTTHSKLCLQLHRELNIFNA